RTARWQTAQPARSPDAHPRQAGPAADGALDERAQQERRRGPRPASDLASGRTRWAHRCVDLTSPSGRKRSADQTSSIAIWVTARQPVGRTPSQTASRLRSLVVFALFLGYAIQSRPPGLMTATAAGATLSSSARVLTKTSTKSQEPSSRSASVTPSSSG